MFLYTALGDSITYGQNASRIGNSYPHQVVSHLQSRSSSQAQVAIVAQPGWTSTDLISVLGQCEGPIRSANVVSIWIGGNDLGLSAVSRGTNLSRDQIEATLTRYGQNLAGIVGTVCQISSARIILCTQYNPFPHSKIAVEGISAMNQITKATAKKFHTELAPVHSWFEGNQSRLIDGYRKGRLEDAMRQGPRPIHPNDKGHRVIAEGLLPYFKVR